MYGVVVCPRCKRAKGVDLEQKTTTCSCGFEIRVVPARVRSRVETAHELAPLVGQANAEIAGGLDIYRKATIPIRRKRSGDVHVRVVGAASKPRDRIGRIRAAAIELTRELEVFSFDDWSRVLAGLGIARPEEALADLVHANLVMEPKSGFYRAVSLSP
ncbi:MAG TPA: DUF1922 domain-containing protein, partial [Thermoplasmata archaeon]|nr:DUF1922 domain-containing protein [Thermoplasmata archaeon]